MWMEMGVVCFKLIFDTGSGKNKKPLRQGGQRQHDSLTLKVVYFTEASSNLVEAQSLCRKTGIFITVHIK
jgi:hypothetical protein